MSLDFLFRVPEFRGLVEAVAKGDGPLSLGGTIDASKPYVLSCLAKAAGRPLVFIRPFRLSLSEPAEECRFYLSRLGVPLPLKPFPAPADDPYLEAPPPLEAVSERMRVLHGFLRGVPAFIFTTLPGLLKPIPRPGDLEGMFLDLEKGRSLDRDIFLRTLAEYGYSREDLIATPGEYAWRGGIVDVFSPWEANPFRIELGGDEIISLREFDTSTQRSIRPLDRIIIPSLREFPGHRGFIEDWRRAARPRRQGASFDFEEKGRLLDRGEVFPSFSYLALLAKDRFVSVDRFLGDALFIVDGLDEVERDWVESRKALEEQYHELRKNKTFCLAPDEMYPPGLWETIRGKALNLQEPASPRGEASFALGFQPVPRFDNRISFFLDYLKKLQEEGEICSIFLANQATRQRMSVLLADHGIPAREAAFALDFPERDEVLLFLGDPGRGFGYPREKRIFFSEKDIFTEERVIVSRAARKAYLSSFQDLRGGDYVIHADYGIGVFQGLQRLLVDGKNREFIEIRYRDGDRLLVPVEDLNLVQKFSKAGTELPPLDKLGSNAWQKTKAKTKKAVEAVAKELLELYARRKALHGFAFSAEGEWQDEFEKSFEYEETDDQLRSVREIKTDMESDAPMDRLICGDVGYGKTEVAMRAAFKAVMDGKQVAVLCPTTVLASQHLNTFRTRLALFPVRVEGLTRLQAKKEQARILGELRAGFVDILIGTHRILSKDVAFKDLGLLIVDEEQRFGVSHKERIKQMRATIDVLTLTATPIPRTLNLSLTGLRDISLIETPPRDRLSVHTVVTPFSARLVASAIRQELARGGQVYYVHNRIEDIDKVAAMVEKLIPQARVVTIHGRMTGAALERRMMDFIARKSNVLISTTIIENGIDIPLVNTLIVDRADLYGLAQLYQLRGRVGRSSRQAYAYFLIPPFTELTPLARERLKALKEFSELGSGFRLAAKDLEIRGAGSLLGHRQHGYMEAVGFDYFMELLGQAIQELKGEKVEEIKPEINLKVEIRIPEDYLPQVNLRLNLYKRLSALEGLEEIERIRGEVEDRFGPVPASVENLLRYGAVKFLAQKVRLAALDRLDGRLIVKLLPSTSIDLARVSSILKKRSGSITPQGVVSLALRSKSDKDILDETILVLKELYGYTIIS